MIKKSLLFLILFLLSLIHLPAQVLEPRIGTIMHRDEARPCLVINLDPEPKTLKNAWIDYIDEKHNIKLRGMGLFANKELLTAEAVVFKKLSKDKIDFYTHVVEDANGSEMKVFAAYGYDIYIDPNSRPKEFKTLENILENFLKSYLPKYNKSLIADTQERIENLNDETADLQDDISDANDRIAELNEEIQEWQATLTEKEEALILAQEKLRQRQQKLERVRKQLKKL